MQALTIVKGTAGAVLGATAGYFLFGWLIDQGLYGLALPGALTGIGASLLSRRRSIVVAIIAGIVAFGVSALCEATFLQDGTLETFLDSIDKQPTMTYVMLVVGVCCAVWLGIGREPYPSSAN